MPKTPEQARAEKKLANLFKASDEEVAEYIANYVDNIRTMLNTNYHEITRLVLKGKICGILLSNVHINRFNLRDYFLALILETKELKKEVWLQRRKR